MSKCQFVVTVTLLVPLLLQTSDCLFAGDSCVGNERAGTCRLLSACQPLVAEIQGAGTPMPARLRRKLQALACGFESNEPLVCCVSPFTNTVAQDSGSTEGWSPPATHGLGVGPTTWLQPQPSGGTVNPWGTDQNSNTPPPEPTRLKPVPSINSNNGAPPNIRGHRNLNLLPDNCGVLESDRIWGGNRTRLYEMPWMVLVAYDSARGTKLSCGGTLITENYVLTAAHCVTFLGSRLSLRGIVLGEYDVRTDPDCERMEGDLHCAPNIRNVTIEKVIAHPGYSPQNLYDDIALVKLSEPADFNLDNMKALCLPSTPELQTESLVGVKGIVAGWGATEDGLQSPVLLSVELPVVSNKDCQDAYNGSPQIFNRQMCAGGVEDKDSCGGDSGGPLMYPGRIRTGGVRYVQRGIVSYGSKRCGLGGYPGVYTRIAYYMDWILDNIGN